MRCWGVLSAGTLRGLLKKLAPTSATFQFRCRPWARSVPAALLKDPFLCHLLQVRATHGAHEGTWYYEVTIEDLGEKGASTGATRIGCAQRNSAASPAACPCSAFPHRRTAQYRVAGPAPAWEGVAVSVGAGRALSSAALGLAPCRRWATARAELQAPVGYDTWGYSYRSKEGSKVSISSMLYQSIEGKDLVC